MKAILSLHFSVIILTENVKIPSLTCAPLHEKCLGRPSRLTAAPLRLPFSLLQFTDDSLKREASEQKDFTAKKKKKKIRHRPFFRIC